MAAGEKPRSIEDEDGTVGSAGHPLIDGTLDARAVAVPAGKETVLLPFPADRETVL
jgi:hypothetical protein